MIKIVLGKVRMKAGGRILLMAVALVLVGCSAVQPWERGHFAKSHMAVDPHPLTNTLRHHNYISREGATGSDNTQGGGCGCY